VVDLVNTYVHAETVGTSSVEILKGSSERTSYGIINRGPGTIFIGNDTPSSTTQGFPLAPMGSYAAYAALGDDIEHEVFAISPNAGNDVRIIETLKV
jgi:hypothetical protein